MEKAMSIVTDIFEIINYVVDQILAIYAKLNPEAPKTEGEESAE